MIVDMTQDELDEILYAHQKWLKGEEGGVVDMMKCIATTWNINAEEVFGVKQNVR